MNDQHTETNVMKSQIKSRGATPFALAGIAVALVAAGCAAVGSGPVARINPTDPQPTCAMCPGTYIPVSEVEAYAQKALRERLVDQQVRAVDIGKANVGIGYVHRGKLD